MEIVRKTGDLNCPEAFPWQTTSCGLEAIQWLWVVFEMIQELWFTQEWSKGCHWVYKIIASKILSKRPMDQFYQAIHIMAHMTIFYYIFFLFLERKTAKENPQPPTTDNHPPLHSNSISLSCGLWPRLPSSDHPWPPQPMAAPTHQYPLITLHGNYPTHPPLETSISNKRKPAKGTTISIRNLSGWWFHISPST